MPMGITRDSWVSVVSLEIPGLQSSHSRFPGFRRLTRDSWNRRLTRDYRIPDFSGKNFWKNRKNRFFGLLGPKWNFRFFLIFLYAWYFLYKPLFPAAQPSNTLKIASAISKSTWGTTYSSFRPGKRPKTAKIDQKAAKNRPMLTFVSFISLSWVL